MEESEKYAEYERIMISQQDLLERLVEHHDALMELIRIYQRDNQRLRESNRKLRRVLFNSN